MKSEGMKGVMTKVCDNSKRSDVEALIPVAVRCAAYPTCTLSIDIDPPSTPSTGKVINSLCWLVASTYNNGK
jgi:hypothetical protein